jgi:hypothetical protein
VDAARKLTADDHAHCAAEALATVPRTLRMEVLLHVHKDMVRSPLRVASARPARGSDGVGSSTDGGSRVGYHL